MIDKSINRRLVKTEVAICEKISWANFCDKQKKNQEAWKEAKKIKCVHKHLYNDECNYDNCNPSGLPPGCSKAD